MWIRGCGIAVGLIAVLTAACGSDETSSGGPGGPATGGDMMTGGGGDGGMGAVGGGAVTCSTVEQISTGHDHTCVRCDGGRVACWGGNTAGHLGRGATSAGDATPAIATAFENVAAIEAGWGTTCATDAAGAMWCLGGNQSGQLGNGATSLNETDPVQVSGLTSVQAMAAGIDRTCAVVGGEVRCWGDNQFRQLGDGTTDASSTPVNVLTLTGVDELDLSDHSHHACARSGGLVSCWGWNASGQLGATTPGGFADTPVAAGGLTDAVSIATGERHTCAVRDAGTVTCFGAAPVGGGNSTPVDVAGVANAVRVVAGTGFSCLLLDDQTVSCWGINQRGQLGNGTTDDAAVPVAVTGLSGVVALDAGGGHVCALTDSGALYCWGDGEFGQTSTDELVTSAPLLVAFE